MEWKQRAKSLTSPGTECGESQLLREYVVQCFLALRLSLFARTKPKSIFFFSSRRRHTRSLCDWSSDVCSSDLHEPERLDAAIEACGMRHRIVSCRTSLVAIAEHVTADPNAPRRRERLAVEMPDGVSVEGTGLMLARGRMLHETQSLEVWGRRTLYESSAPREPRRMARGMGPGDFLTGLFRSAKRPGESKGTPSDGAAAVEIPATLVRIEGDLLTV